jgi:hypothetical protein
VPDAKQEPVRPGQPVGCGVGPQTCTLTSAECPKQSAADLPQAGILALQGGEDVKQDTGYGTPLCALGTTRAAQSIGQAARMLRLNPAKAKHFITRAMESLKHIFLCGMKSRLAILTALLKRPCIKKCWY